MRSKFIAIFMMLGAVTTPATAQLFKPDQFMLPNGMRVVVMTNKSAPVIHHMLWVGAGGACDPWGKSGIAHFLEHMLFKGTKKHPGGDYGRIIARLGGEQNAFTTQDATAYYATIARDHIDTVMALEADRLANIRIDPRDVAAEKSVILREREQRIENDPVSAFFEEADAALFTNHPYQRPVIGWRGEIEKLTSDDLRNFYQTYYAPKNMVLVLSGDIGVRQARALTSRHYGGLKNPQSAATACDLPDVVPPAHARHVAARSPLVRETIWSRHWVVEPARPKTILMSDALRVLAHVVGDDRTGRLYKKLVVEKKLASSVSVQFDPVARGMTRFSVAATPLPGVSTRALSRYVTNELDGVLKNGITADELRTAQTALDIMSVYARDGVTAPAFIVGRALTSGLDIKTVEAWPWRIRAVTLDAVHAAARSVLSRAPVTAVIRPAGNGDAP